MTHIVIPIGNNTINPWKKYWSNFFKYARKDIRRCAWFMQLIKV